MVQDRQPKVNSRSINNLYYVSAKNLRLIHSSQLTTMKHPRNSSINNDLQKQQLLKYTCMVSEHQDLVRSKIMNARNFSYIKLSIFPEITPPPPPKYSDTSSYRNAC